MDGDPRRLGKALHAVGNHLTAQVSNLLALETELNDGIGPVRKVDNGTGQGLVKRAVGGSEAGDANGRTEGFFEGRAKGYADVFCAVVVIDCEVPLASFGHVCTTEQCSLTVKITLTPECQTPPSMLRQRMQHVVQKSNTGVYADRLALRGLARMALQGRNEALVNALGKGTPIDIDGQLDLRLVGVAREDRSANPL